jgi:hypothetical protein
MRKTFKKRGGRKVGEGVYGQVFRPPLHCKGESVQKWSNDYVSKTVYKAVSEKELHNSLLVKSLDPHGEWSITAESICEVNKVQTNEDYKSGDERTEQIIFRYGGVSLDSLLQKPNVKGNPMYLINKITEEGKMDIHAFESLQSEGLAELVRQVKKLLPKLDVLNKRYCHGDLHFKNIVTDGEIPRLIDFDSLYQVEVQYAEEKKLLDRCVKIKSDCEWLTDRLDLTLYDSVRSDDVRRLWQGFVTIFESEWIKEVFPRKYDAWLNKEKPYFRSDYVLSIYSIPV